MPVDFKRLTKELQDKTGSCLLQDTHYDCVDGYRINCLTGEKTEEKIHYRIDESRSGRKIFKILNGVTGYESYYVSDLLASKSEDLSGFWAACGLTKGRWDGLYVNAKQVNAKLMNLQLTNENL